MINKMKSIKKANSKKILAVIACATLALTFGTNISSASAKASDSSHSKIVSKVFKQNEDRKNKYSELVRASDSKEEKFSDIMVNIDDNGKITYSEDGGKTWSDKTPEGLEFQFNDEEGQDSDIMVNIDEKGNITYSRDGGETWIEGLPEGVEFDINPEKQ